MEIALRRLVAIGLEFTADPLKLLLYIAIKEYILALIYV